MVNQNQNCSLVSLVGKVPVYCAGGSGSIPGQTNTQDEKAAFALKFASSWIRALYRSVGPVS